MMMSEHDDRVYLDTSTIPGAGRGLFARRPLRAGERLEAHGVRVARGSIADDCTAYADAYKFRIGDLLLIPTGYAGMVNHSLEPNLRKVIEGEGVYLEVIRQIGAGEELFFCYSEYAQDRFALNPPRSGG